MTSKNYFPLPIDLNEITPEWITAAIQQRHPNAEVSKVEIVDIIRGTSSKIRLRLTQEPSRQQDDIPELVILKGGFEPHSRGLCHMHEREVIGYRDVLTQIDLPAPTCYFADYDAEREQGIIIMEDLQHSGVSFCHALTPQSFEQVARRLEVLAKFHAATWDSTDLINENKWGKLPDFLGAVESFFALKTEPDTWQRFLNSPRGAACSTKFHNRDWMIEAWNKIQILAGQRPHSVLHGDIHLGNLYIRDDGTPGFFDTLASRGPGMLEVSYHISASVDSSNRARWEGALVQHYLNALSDCGVTPPSFDDAMYQYAIFLIYGHFIWMTTESEYQIESVNSANTARVSSAMLDHHTFELLEDIKL